MNREIDVTPMTAPPNEKHLQDTITSRIRIVRDPELIPEDFAVRYLEALADRLPKQPPLTLDSLVRQAPHRFRVQDLETGVVYAVTLVDGTLVPVVEVTTR